MIELLAQIDDCLDHGETAIADFLLTASIKKARRRKDHETHCALLRKYAEVSAEVADDEHLPDWKDAARAWTKLIKIAGDIDFEGWHALAWAEFMGSSATKARKALARAQELASTDTEQADVALSDAAMKSAQRASKTGAKRLDKAIAAFDTCAEDDVRLAACERISRAFNQRHRPEGLAFAERAHAIAMQRHPPYHRVVASAVRVLRVAHLVAHQNDLARTCSDAWEMAVDAALDEGDDRRSSLWLARAARSAPADALELRLQVHAASERRHGPSNPALYPSLYSLAVTAQRAKDWPRAVELWERVAAALRKQRKRDARFDLVTVLKDLREGYLALERFDEAEATLDEQEAVQHTLPEHWNRPLHVQRANVDVARGDVAAAAQHYRDAVAEEEDKSGLTGHNTDLARSWASAFFVRHDMWDDAKRILDGQLAAHEAAHSAAPSDVTRRLLAAAHRHASWRYRDKGDAQREQEHLARAAELEA